MDDRDGVILFDHTDHVPAKAVENRKDAAVFEVLQAISLVLIAVVFDGNLQLLPPQIEHANRSALFVEDW